MSDLIRKNDAIDILCKFCGITEYVEKCRKTSADGWCKEYCELKNMPTVEAIPIEWMLNSWDSKEYADVGYQVMRRIIADWTKRKEE